MAERHILKTRVTVTGIVPGTPPVLAFSERLQIMGGKEKRHQQQVYVTDPLLYRRLQDEAIKHGDEIEATLATDWYDDRFSTSLIDFLPLPTERAEPDQAAAHRHVHDGV